MTDADPDFDTLSAYVDGELPAAEMSIIDRLVADDDKVARTVAILLEMKRSVVTLAPDVVLLKAPINIPHRRFASPLMIAAAIFCALIVGALLWASLPLVGPPAPGMSPLVAEAITLHDRWATDGPTLSAPAADIPDFDRPELTAAGLTLVTVRSDVVIEGTRSIQAGYLGQHGCRLSLFELAENDAGDPFHVTSFGDLQSATWGFGPARYIAVARNMDTTRFALLANAMKAMTLHLEEPPVTDVIAQLKKAHLPCDS